MDEVLLCLGGLPSRRFRKVPLFVLELGMGQLTRRGTLGMWTKIGLPRWQGVGWDLG